MSTTDGQLAPGSGSGPGTGAHNPHPVPLPEGEGRWARWRRPVVLGLGAALLLFSVYEYVTLPAAAPLATQNPKTTALIEKRAAEAREAGKKARRRQQWVPLSSISKHAVDAVLLSEDASFYLHDGVDTVELGKAVGEAVEKGELGRGASTITQQLAKNLWLSNDRSLLRKLKELVLAHRLEEALTKKRILTLYLNVVEWGNGVYGIEAGAREHFGVSASQLSVAQGAILASMLPAPRKRSPASGSRALWKHSHRVLDRLQAVHRISDGEAAAAHKEVDRLLGRAPADGDGADDSGDSE